MHEFKLDPVSIRRPFLSSLPYCNLPDTVRVSWNSIALGYRLGPGVVNCGVWLYLRTTSSNCIQLLFPCDPVSSTALFKDSSCHGPWLSARPSQTLCTLHREEDKRCSPSGSRSPSPLLGSLAPPVLSSITSQYLTHRLCFSLTSMQHTPPFQPICAIVFCLPSLTAVAMNFPSMANTETYGASSSS